MLDAIAAANDDDGEDHVKVVKFLLFFFCRTIKKNCVSINIFVLKPGHISNALSERVTD